MQALGPAHSAELMDELLSCNQFDKLPDRLLAPVSHALGAKSSVFLQFYDIPSDCNIVGRHYYRGKTPRSVEVYAEGYYEADPVVQPSLQYLRARQNGEGALVTLLSAIPGWRESDYYRNFLKPFDIGHVLAMAVPVKTIFRREMLCLGFHRTHDDQPFNSREVGQLRALTPVVQTVLTNLALREAVSMSETLLEALAEEGPGLGFLVLDEDLAIVNGNERGLEHLGLVDKGRRGVLPSSELLGALRQRLLTSQQGAMPQNLSLAGIDIEIRALDGERGQLRYLLLTRTSRGPSVKEACRRLGLSDREIEVATLASLGHRSAEIGGHLGISPRTVENHLRSIYAKTSVTSRTQLASRLMGTPASDARANVSEASSQLKRRDIRGAPASVGASE